MVWPIAFAVISLFINWSDFFEPMNLPNGFELISGVFLGLAVGFVVSNVVGWFLPKEWREYSRRQLTTVNDIRTDTCYIGKGRRDGNMYFGWKTKDDEKFHAVDIGTSIEIAVVDAEHASKPELRMFKRAFKHPIAYFFAIESYDMMYEFHVPPGTYNPHLPDGTFA